jgi:hypothetical protein
MKIHLTKAFSGQRFSFWTLDFGFWADFVSAERNREEGGCQENEFRTEG